MKKVAFFLGAVILVLDKLTKGWAESHADLLGGYRGLPVIEGFLKLQLVSNKGIAFGLLHAADGTWKPILLAVVALVAVTALIVYMFYTPERERLMFVSYGLLLGGILGNLHDRIFRGEVTDFITLHWKDAYAWPTFNVADAAITTGVFLLLFSTFFRRGKEGPGAGALVMAALLFPSPQAADAEAVLAGVESAYQDVESFSADFVQAFSSRGVSSTETGRVLMKRPGYMRWEYLAPERKLFIADGKKTWFYLEDEKQLLIADFDIEQSRSPLLFFLGHGDIRTRFAASLVEQEEGMREEGSLIRLVPLEPDPEIEELVMEVDPSAYLIRRIIVRDPVGQQNEYILTNMHKNVHISNSQFKIKVPEDVEVIEQ